MTFALSEKKSIFKAQASLSRGSKNLCVLFIVIIFTDDLETRRKKLPVYKREQVLIKMIKTIKMINMIIMIIMIKMITIIKNDQNDEMNK